MVCCVVIFFCSIDDEIFNKMMNRHYGGVIILKIGHVGDDEDSLLCFFLSLRSRVWLIRISLLLINHVNNTRIMKNLLDEFPIYRAIIILTPWIDRWQSFLSSESSYYFT